MLRIGIFLVGTLLLIALIVQIVLWTSLPKALVVSEVEKGLGLRMAVNGLSTGWLGHTSVGGAKLALPLSERAFLEVPEMKVDHTNLLGLALGWPIEIKRIELSRPVLYVRQNVAGRWDLQEVAELLARAGGKKTGDQTAQTSTTPALPTILIQGMTIVVIDNHDRQVKIEPINVDGKPDSGVSWKYDIEIPSQQPNVPPHLSLLGRVAPGGFWAHEATIWVHDLAPWIRPWVPSFNQAIAFHGNWSGQLNEKGVGGYLQIKDSTFGVYHADGALSATQSGGSVSVRPENLHLSMSDPAVPADAQSPLTVSIPSGTLEYDGATARATQVQLALMGGPATFNGWFSPALNQGALEAYWQNLVVPNAGITQSGKLNATFSRPVAAPIRIEAVVSSSGVAENFPFDAVAKFNATGDRFTEMTWQLATPQLAYYRPPQPVILNGLSMAGNYRQDSAHKLVNVERVSLPADNRLAGTASYDLETKQGQVHLEGQEWPVHLIEGTRLAFVLDAAGRGVPSDTTPKKTVVAVDLNQFTLRSGDAALSLKGTYDGRRPKPVVADVKFSNVPGVATQVGQPSLIHGYVLGEAQLVGTLSPRQIGVTGSLSGRDAELFGHPVGDISTKLAGIIDPEKANIQANGIPFLDGIWNLGATYVTQQDGKPVYATTVDMSVDRLPLPKVTEFLKAQRIDGMFAGHWYLYFPGLKPTATNIALTGGGSVRNLAASSLVADEMTFTTTLTKGVFKVDPVRLTRGNYGRIDAHAQLALNNWRQVTAGLNFTGFPIDLTGAGVGLQLFGGAVAPDDESQGDPITVYLPDAKSKDPAARILRVNTRLNVRTVISIESQADAQGHRTMQPEGEIRTLASMHGRLLDLREVHGNVMGGTVTADGVSDLTDLDHVLNQTRLNLNWNELQSEQLVRLYPGIKGFGGTYSGKARLQPATGARPLEPLALNIYSQPKNGHWRTVNLGDAEIHAFIGPHRVISSDQQVCTLKMGGGSIDFWFSSSGHLDLSPPPAGGAPTLTGITLSNQLNLTLRALDIDQFVTAFDPTHPPGFGKLGGSAFLLSAPKTRTVAAMASATTAPATQPATSTSQVATQQQQDLLQRLLRTTTVDGNVEIAQSDLGNFGPIAALYNLMNLGTDIRRPTGHGTVSFHMEDALLHISNLYYFNRGVEVRGVATVDQFWKLEESPVDGSALGTLRPLKNTKFPLLAEADAVLSGLQKQLSGVLFNGPLKGPYTIRHLGLTEIGSELRGILLGEIGANRNP